MKGARVAFLFVCVCVCVCACATSKPLPPPAPVVPEVAEPALPAPPDVAAPPDDAERTWSGLATKVVKPGSGAQHPRVTDRVYIRYSAWTTDGKMFLLDEGAWSVTDFLPGWAEGIQLMVVGEKRRMWIPPRLGYVGRDDGPKGMIVFDVELVEINPPQYAEPNAAT